ncbi:MAG: hypothetical protein JWP75_2977 [Frondihabitans sp.]|nr:hypothetical protein [Frondihabitans sp.]
MIQTPTREQVLESETAPTSPHSGADQPLGPTRSTAVVVVFWVGTLLALVVIIAALVFQARGGRWFIVETPSMGRAAPVGTLVLTTPATHLRVGSVITFHPPTAPREVYTHRIVKITPAGAITTRGDINGATDPWTLGRKDVIGQAASILPGLGWLIKALPILVIGGVVLSLLRRLIRTPSRRVSAVILGGSLLASVTVFLVKPLVGLVVLQNSTLHDRVAATVVSTGLLPIRAQAIGGTRVDLVAGQVGRVSVSGVAKIGHYHLSSALHLSPLGWIVLGVICAIPLIWTLAVGLPPNPPADIDIDNAVA